MIRRHGRAPWLDALQGPAAHRLPPRALDAARRLRSALEAVGGGRLDGYCVVASRALRDALFERGIDARVMYGHVARGRSHAWVEVAREVVVDLTATQFWGVDPVYVVDVMHDRYRCKGNPTPDAEVDLIGYLHQDEPWLPGLLRRRMEDPSGRLDVGDSLSA